MLPVLDGLAMLGLSMIQLFFSPAGYLFVLAFLAALTVLAGDALFVFDPHARWRLGICTACMAFIPEFCFFFPAFTCKASQKKQWFFPVIGAIIALGQFLEGRFTLAGLSLSLVSASIAWYSGEKSRKLEACRQELLSHIDSSREYSLLLEEKNKALREKQDYEIYTATLRERNRIAREIHDNVGHLLSRSILLAGAMKAINREEGLRQPLSDLESSLNTAMTSIRSSVHDLHDEAVDLETASRDLMQQFTFCKAELRYDMSRSVPKEVKYCFLAILKEALNNVMKHSSATLVEVRMKEQPGLYQLIIRDNGPASPIQSTGIGLTNMSQRVQELGGIFKIHTENGFEIFITVPRRCKPCEF